MAQLEPRSKARPHPLGRAGTRAVIYALLLAAQGMVAFLFLGDDSPGDASARLGLPLDDGWIHLVYARSLAAFEGFAYNPGQQEAGFTSPLWAALLAPLFWIRLPWDLSLVLVVKVVGVLVAWVSSIYGCRLGARLAGPGCGVLLGSMIALDPWLAFGAVSGMEVPLAAATLLAAFDYALTGRWRTAGVASALALWSRPEAFVVVATLVAFVAWHLRASDPRARRRRLLELAAPPALAAFLWSAWCVSITGRLLPSAFYVKHQEGPIGSFADVPAVLFVQLADLPWLYAGSGLLLFAAGAWHLWRAGGRPEVRRALVVAGPLWVLAVAWAHRMNEPLAFYWHRYLDPGVPLVLGPVAVGLWALLRLALGREAPAPRRATAGAAAVALVALMTWTLPGKLARNAEAQAWSARNVQDLHVHLGAWLRERSEPGDWLVTHDAGAIRFASERPVIDMLGINHREVLNGRLPQVLEAHPPRFLAVIPAWYPELVRDRRTREVYRVRAEHFVICDGCEQDEMVVLEPAGRTP